MPFVEFTSDGRPVLINTDRIKKVKQDSSGYVHVYVGDESFEASGSYSQVVAAIREAIAHP